VSPFQAPLQVVSQRLPHCLAARGFSFAWGDRL
jgi:hypothetical protein